MADLEYDQDDRNNDSAWFGYHFGHLWDDAEADRMTEQEAFDEHYGDDGPDIEADDFGPTLDWPTLFP